VIYEAATPVLVGPLRLMVAEPPAPPEPESQAAAPAVDPEQAQREAERAREEQVAREERERLQGVLGELLDAARELREAQRARLGEMQKVAVELAMAVASHMLHDRLESGDFPIEELVRAAVKRLEPRQAVIVRLHPDDLALLERRTADEPLFALDTEELRLIADPSLRRGDCRAETGDVAVVANLEEHLAEIRRDLLRALPEAEIERRQPAGERTLRRYPDRRHTA
jgi:flagellar biosynthesis/type III secretory pathway protein FliH